MSIPQRLGSPRMVRALSRVPLMMLCLASLASAAQPVPPRRSPPLNGTVVALKGRQLRVEIVENGTLTVTLASNARVIEQLPASLSEVKTGRFIGATAVQRPDGRLVATEIHLFPDSMRGTGEGHYPMGAPRTTMTNGDVQAVSGSVAAAGGSPGAQSLTLRVAYKGGDSRITVPPDVTVTQMRPGNRALLRAGARVTIFAQRGADGRLGAAMLIVHSAAG